MVRAIEALLSVAVRRGTLHGTLQLGTHELIVRHRARRTDEVARDLVRKELALSTILAPR